MNQYYKYLVLFLIAIVFTQIAVAQNFVEDAGEYLSPNEETILEEKLKSYSDSTTNQIAIRTIQSLGGENLRTYSLNLARELGIGQEGKNNGILILLVKAERRIRIEVGYGLTDIITNYEADRIIAQSLSPNLKAAQNFQALQEATDDIIVLIQKAKDTLSSSSTTRKEDEVNEQGFTKKELKRLEEIPEELKSSDFMVDYGEFISNSRARGLDNQLRNYASTNNACIWIRTVYDEELPYDVEELIFKHLISENPGKDNYAFIYVKHSTFYNSEMDAELYMALADGRVQEEYDADLQLKEIIKAFNDEVLHHYFEVNGNFRYWPYPGLTRTVHLLKKYYKGDLEVEDIGPHWFYSDNPLNQFIFMMVAIIGAVFGVMLIAYLFGGMRGGGGSSGGSSGYGPFFGGFGSGNYNDNSYDSGSSSGGGGGGSFGGGDFGGDGGSGDY